MSIENPERQNRIEKMNRLKVAGISIYPAKFDKTHNLKAVHDLKEGESIKSAGRLMTLRDMGKITFGHLLDASGKTQIVFQKDEIGEESYGLFMNEIDLGDFLGVEGQVFVTKKGERSILVKKWIFLGKAILPLPEKFHGLQDQEVAYRQRYLDLVANDGVMERFVFRSNLIKALREFYWQEGFLEVETSTLMHQATGAAARPYYTHNNAEDIDLVLRISHELPLKELIVGGFEKIFELGKVFRNEGKDPSHLPEHTHLEHYCAYWDFEDNIKFTEKMFDYIFNNLKLKKKTTILDRDGQEQEVDFSTPWQRLDYIATVNQDSGLDILSYDDADKLRSDLKKMKIEFEGMNEMGLSTLIDNIYKKVTRLKIVNPTIVYNYPKIVQPLARTNDQDERIVDQFQLVINGWEMLKAYSELVDPLDQRARFEEQAAAKEAGDEEAFEVDEEYLTAMEHGMPPISGWGMGVDRIVAILTKQNNLRDVILFPLVKPEEPENQKTKKLKNEDFNNN